MATIGLNKAQVIGFLGSDPDVRYLPNGVCTTSINLATTEKWKGKDDGAQGGERTEWHRVVFFGKPAEIAGEYLRKGSRCFVEGSMRTRKWKDNQDIERYSTEIIVQGYTGILQLLDRKPNEQ